jgi:hypothetical protein
MSGRNVRFTAADVRRAIEAVVAAGKTVAAVQFPLEGGFRVRICEPANAADQAPNEWDEVLSPEYYWAARANVEEPAAPRKRALERVRERIARRTKGLSRGRAKPCSATTPKASQAGSA